jgi:hypothetical protein
VVERGDGLEDLLVVVGLVTEIAVESREVDDSSESDDRTVLIGTARTKNYH